MSGEQPDVDDRFAELVQIRQQLDTTEDLAERVSLIERQRELQSQLKGHDLSGRSTSELQALEQALVKRRESLLERRMDMGAVGRGGSWNEGLDPAATMAHNRAVDEASGLAQVDQELAAVRAELNVRSSE